MAKCLARGKRQKEKEIKNKTGPKRKNNILFTSHFVCGQNCFVVSNTALWGIPRSMSLNYNILFNKSYFFFIAPRTDATV